MARHDDNPPRLIERTYTALLRDDGAILPITESIGRRVIRVIDPEGREGRLLLSAGKVTLWSSDGRKLPRLPVDQLLHRMQADLKEKLSEHPRDRRWEEHFRGLARSVSRSRSRLSH
jgi:hypothetical protein